MDGAFWVFLYALMVFIPLFRIVVPRLPRAAIAIRRLSNRARRAAFVLSLAALLVATPGVPAAIAFVIMPFLRRSFPVGLLSSIVPAATNPHLLATHPHPDVRRAYQVASVGGSERLEERIMEALPDHMHPLAPFIAVIVRNPGQGTQQVVLLMQMVYVAMAQVVGQLFAQRAGFVISPFVISFFSLAVLHLGGVSPGTEVMMDISTSALLALGALIIGEL